MWSGAVKIHLAEALGSYCTRSSGKIIFRGNLTLNKLALVIWEESSTCGLDASILSKVINGKRLFTPRQLSIFCKVLNIKNRDREFLFYCLHKDQSIKSGVVFDTPFIPSSGTYRFIEALMHKLDDLFTRGKWRDVYHLSSILEAYLHEYFCGIYPNNPEDALVATYQKTLYLQTKAWEELQGKSMSPRLRSVGKNVNDL